MRRRGELTDDEEDGMASMSQQIESVWKSNGDLASQLEVCFLQSYSGTSS